MECGLEFMIQFITSVLHNFGWALWCCLQIKKIEIQLKVV